MKQSPLEIWFPFHSTVLLSTLVKVHFLSHDKVDFLSHDLLLAGIMVHCVG